VTSTVKDEVWPASKKARLVTVDGVLHGHAVNSSCFLDVEIKKSDFQADLLIPPKSILQEIKGRHEEINFEVGVAGITVGTATLSYSLGKDFALPPNKPQRTKEIPGELIEGFAYLSKLAATKRLFNTPISFLSFKEEEHKSMVQLASSLGSSNLMVVTVFSMVPTVFGAAYRG